MNVVVLSHWRFHIICVDAMRPRVLQLTAGAVCAPPLRFYHSCLFYFNKAKPIHAAPDSLPKPFDKTRFD
jgi:hypothetical protein